MKFVNGLMIALIGVSAFTVSCRKKGCTDPIATNYEEKAKKDDGSCNYDVDINKKIVVTENITVPTTWSAGTVEVCGDILVTAALTIKPGVTVIMCAGASLDIKETGSLDATGTATSRIVFKGKSTSKGFWAGIKIGSNNPNNRFDYVTISDAGSYWYWEFANIYVDELSKLSLKNSIISNSEKIGLFAEDNATFSEFSNNIFSNNAIEGLNIYSYQVSSLDEASNYNSGNGESFIKIRGGSIGTNATWKKTNTPYLVSENLIIEAGLTLNPGVSILMEANRAIDVRETGFLNAEGNASSPITIKGRYNSAGFWSGIIVQANNPNNKMKYVTLTDGGGYWYYEFSSLYIDSGRMDLDNSTVSNSNSWGIYVNSSAALYSAGTAQTDAAGVMANNSITGNGAGADADCSGGGCTVNFE